MIISIEHHDQSFNVCLSSAAGKEPFIVIKGCRIASGSKGEFVSWPATKNQNTGKWWNHVYATEAFAQAVLEKVKESAPKPASRKQDPQDDESDVPF